MSAHQSQIQRTSTLTFCLQNTRERVIKPGIQISDSTGTQLASQTLNIEEEEALFDVQYRMAYGCTVQSDFLRVNTNQPPGWAGAYHLASAENDL